MTDFKQKFNKHQQNLTKPYRFFHFDEKMKMTMNLPLKLSWRKIFQKRVIFIYSLFFLTRMNEMYNIFLHPPRNPFFKQSKEMYNLSNIGSDFGIDLLTFSCVVLPGFDLSISSK